VSLPHRQSCGKDWNLLESKSWLNGRLINYGMNLLKIRYPKDKGLQDCTLLDTLKFESIEGEFVQILNYDRTHWICISSFRGKQGTVDVFDSTRSGEIHLVQKKP